MSPTQPKHLRFSAYGILWIVVSTMFFLYGEIDYLGEFAHIDLQYYREMAVAAPAIDTHMRAPFGYRILPPYLAGLLPFPDPMAFRFLTYIALLTLCMVYFYFLQSHGITPTIALHITIFFTFNSYFFGLIAFNAFQLGDALILIWILGAVLALERKHWIYYSLFAVLGVLTRETMLLMLPLSFLFLHQKQHFSTEKKAWFVSSFMILLVFFSLRMTIRPPNDWNLMQAIQDSSAELISPYVWYKVLINALIPFSLLPIIYWRTTKSWLKGNRAWIVFTLLVVCSTFLGADDERLMAPAFIPFYWLIANIVQNYFPKQTLFWVLLYCATFLTSFHHLVARFPLPNRYITIVLSLLALSGVTIFGFWAKRQKIQAIGT